MKSTLVGEYVLNPYDPTPFEKFPWITRTMWAQFHATKSTPESRAKSEAYRALQARNVHPHRLGTGGYSGKQEQWQKEDEAAAQSNTPPPFADAPEGRARNWARARGIPNCDGTITFPNAKDQRVYEKLVSTTH